MSVEHLVYLEGEIADHNRLADKLILEYSDCKDEKLKRSISGKIDYHLKELEKFTKELKEYWANLIKEGQ